MEQGTRKMAVRLFAAALGTTLLAAPAAQAISFAEPGDAGQTLATATPTGTNNTVALNTITGSIGTSTDADLFILTITNTTTFSATVTSGVDTSLFLFSASGAAVIANDDANGNTLASAIPAGNSFLTTLSAGTYYLGISLSGNEPVNLPNQLLFTGDNPTTNVRGAASGLNPTTLDRFNSQTFYAETGTYSIALTGANTAAAVPEPSTWAALLAATAALGLAAKHRQQKQAV